MIKKRTSRDKRRAAMSKFLNGSKSLNGTKSYSPLEARALDLLSAQPTTTQELTKKLYAKHKQRPHNSRQAVLSVLSSLARKVESNAENFRVCRDERRGPHPVNFWIEKK